MPCAFCWEAKNISILTWRIPKVSRWKKRLDQQTYLAPNYLSRRGTTFKLLHTYILSLSHTDHFEDRWANAHCRIGISSLEVVKWWFLFLWLKVTVIKEEMNGVWPRGSVRAGVAGGWGAAALPDIGRSVKHIQTTRAGYAHHINTCPPDFQTFLRPCSQ